jgi:hypothetical protein
MNEYKLVNPYIFGSLKTACKANTSEQAAEKLWKQFSKYTNNNVPKFYFSIKQKGGELHHFMVKEKLKNKENVDYNIEKITVKKPGGAKKIYKHIQKIKKLMQIDEKKHSQSAGHHHHRYRDSSSSSSSSSEYLTSVNKILLRKLLHRSRFENEMVVSPMEYLWYNPVIYDYSDVYIPTFVNVVPRVQVWGLL